MHTHNKVEVFDIYQDLKLPAICEDLVAITMFDTEVAVHQIEAKDPLAKVLIKS